MRYPYYRYQFGGAGTEEAKGPEPTIESITTEQAQDYEQKNWLQGWHVHNLFSRLLLVIKKPL